MYFLRDQSNRIYKFDWSKTNAAIVQRDTMLTTVCISHVQPTSGFIKTELRESLSTGFRESRLEVCVRIST